MSRALAGGARLESHAPRALLDAGAAGLAGGTAGFALGRRGRGGAPNVRQ